MEGILTGRVSASPLGALCELEEHPPSHRHCLGGGGTQLGEQMTPLCPLEEEAGLSLGP